VISIHPVFVAGKMSISSAQYAGYLVIT
jgi:hypothetical protein